MKKRRWQNLSNSSGSQICCLTSRCRASKDLLFFLTNQTKVQMLDYGQTTRKVKVSSILSPSSSKQKGKKNTWSQVNSHQSILHKNYFFYCEHFNFPINPFAPEPPVRIQVLSTLCDVISFNGQGQLSSLHNSVKDTREISKRPRDIDLKISMKILFHCSPTFPFT